MIILSLIPSIEIRFGLYSSLQWRNSCDQWFEYCVDYLPVRYIIYATRASTNNWSTMDNPTVLAPLSSFLEYALSTAQNIFDKLPGSAVIQRCVTIQEGLSWNSYLPFEPYSSLVQEQKKAGNILSSSPRSYVFYAQPTHILKFFSLLSSRKQMS